MSEAWWVIGQIEEAGISKPIDAWCLFDADGRLAATVTLAGTLSKSHIVVQQSTEGVFHKDALWISERHAKDHCEKATGLEATGLEGNK